jgi:hypothetical protein
MANFSKDIDKLISKILVEEIESKSHKKSEEIGEKLHGNQKKIDVAEPKGKITAADFKKLRSKKETNEMEEMDELFFYDDEEIEDAENASKQEPTYVGKGLRDNKMKADLANKIFGSFDDEHGWFDQEDREYKDGFDFEYDEEEFPDYESLMAKYGDKQNWFNPKEGKKFFKVYQDMFGGAPFKIRKMKGLEEEAETEEGNYFSGQRADAIKDGKKTFEVGDKTYPVKGSKKIDEAKKEKWIQKTGMKKGSLHKKLGIPEGETIPQSKLKSLKKELMKKAEGDKKLSAADSKLLKQVNLALTLKDIKESVNKITLTEDELVDMIEKIVMEQKKKDSNISGSEALGLKKTEKVLKASKKENDNNKKEVEEKMRDYVKDGSKGKFEMDPEQFPKNNYQMDKEGKIMKYTPSQAVEEYIEAFAYPGMTNLVYDEIKPDDEKIEKYIKGDSTTGNAVKDKDGKALGNVVPSEVGERFMKNYKDNLYGAEQMNVSYKRQPQPVDVGGSEKMEGSLKSIRKGSTNKAQKIMNQLESKENKESKVISEEMARMKNLIGYNQKTQ